MGMGIKRERTAPVESMDTIKTADIERARLVCATHATDADDLTQLLDTLGIGNGWRLSWHGPLDES
jgi:hypothetical protein